jgi:flagellin
MAIGISPPGISSLNQAQSVQQINLQRQSSGLRINSAKDDPAGLAIIVRLSSQLGGTQQAINNIGSGVDLADTANGGLSTISDNLQQIQTLAVQASNSTNSASDLQAIQGEINQLSQNINQVTGNTQFNGQNLLNGGFNATIQAGANAGDTVQVSIGATDTTSLGISGIDVTSFAGAQAAITAAQSAQDLVTGQQASLGAISAGLNTNISNLSNTYENLAAARSRIGDNNYSTSSTNVATSNVQTQAGLSVLAAYNAQLKSPLRLLGIA